MRKILTWMLVLSCALVPLAGCKSGTQAADTSDAVISSVEDTDWYELQEDSGVLTVHLPVDGSGYEWGYSIPENGLVELLTQETQDKTYDASFRSIADGTGTLSFAYAKGGSIAAIRTLELRCKDGKVAEVITHAAMSFEIETEGTTDIKELRAANHLLKVMKDHSALTCVSETWDGNDEWLYKTVTQFTRSGDRLWYDLERTGENDEDIELRAGYINDDVPGAYYEVVNGGDKHMEIYPADEYEEFIAERWLPERDWLEENITEESVDMEYHTRVISVEQTSADQSEHRSVIYFVDTETGLITGMEETEYSPFDPSEVIRVTRSNIMYDEPRLMEQRAAMEILFPEDACYLTLTLDPGGNEREQQYQIRKDTLVEFRAREEYELFYDYDCEQPMEQIDVGQNKLSIYARCAK